MSNYTITTNFGAKDDLPSGNAAKVIKGSEFTTEFTNIKTAVNSKADSVSPTFTGDTALNGTTTFGPDGTSTFNGTVNFTKDVTFDTNTMFVDVSENKVGIGTTSPAYTLDIEADTAQARIHSTVGNSVLRLDTVDDGESKIFFADNSASAIGTIEYHHDSNYMSFDTVATERMRIDSAGRLLIGGTQIQSPSSIDKGVFIQSQTNNEVVGVNLYTNEASNNRRADFFLDDANGIYGMHSTASTGLPDFVIKSADNERFRVTDSGNVGIGTNSPDQKAHLSGAGTQYLRVENTTNSVVTDFGTSSTGSTIINRSAHPIEFFTDSTKRMTIDATGNVGIGTTSPAKALHVKSGNDTVRLESTGSNTKIEMVNTGSTTNEFGFLSNNFFVAPDGTERMRIDSSGNATFNTTNISPAVNNVNGTALLQYGGASMSRNNSTTIELNRGSSDGAIIGLRKDGTTVGSIGVNSSTLLQVSSASSGGLFFADNGNNKFGFVNSENALRPASDNQIDLGKTDRRFKDLYRSGSTYSTSDRNKKQDIRDLTDAEARVATVAKGSLKAFRYIDSVEAEGDEANIHFGIIAQDLKAAFEAEGLNADSYQVLKTSTYTDDDGVEQTTYSVCYENLLAFIISAI